MYGYGYKYTASGSIGSNVNQLPEDFVMNITSRSGLSLVDTLEGNASILVPVAKFNGSNNYLQANRTGIAGGQPWDITIRFKVANTASNSCLFHCGGYSASTRGILIRVNSGAVNVLTTDGTSQQSASFAHTLANNTWYTLRVQWDGTTGGTITTTIGATALTSTNSLQWAGEPSVNIQIGRYSTNYLNGSISQITGTWGGLALDMWLTGKNTIEIDTKGLKQFTWYGDAGYTAYDSGSTAHLDYGYTIFKSSANVYQYFAHNSTGENLGLSTLLGGTYSKIANVTGSTKHNLWDSYIRFAPDFFDRSNETIWNAACRESAYYLSGTPKDFHISELNLLTMQSYLNNAYRGMLYPKFTGNSIDERVSLDEILLYQTDYKGDSQLPILRYTGDIARGNKALDNTYDVDANGYIKAYLYNDLGYEADAETNHTTLQALINAGNCTLGNDRYQVFVISKPLIVPSNRTITLNCELRMKKGVETALTANIAENATVYPVTSVEGFAIGQQIMANDNLLEVQAGGTQTRRVASCGTIGSVDTENLTITVDTPSEYAITAASGGKLGHAQSVILIESVENVTIQGKGAVNGRRYNQMDAEPVYGTEDTRYLCGITAWDSNNVIIKGDSEPDFLVRDCGLHNVSIWGNNGRTTGNDCEVAQLTADYAHDKNILFVRSYRGNVHDVTCKRASFEDGIIFYLENNDFTINNVTLIDNARSGLTLGANNDCDATVSNVTTNDRITVRSSNVEFSNISLSGDLAYINIDDTYTGGNDLTFNDVAFSRAWTDSLGLVIIRGAVARITFNDLTMDSCRTDAVSAMFIDAGAGETEPDDVLFDGGGITNHTGTKYNVSAEAGVTFTDFTGYPV